MEPVEDFRALKVVVLAGGDSSEWQISLMSGWQSYAALEAAGHQATWIDPLATDIETFNWQDYDACFIALHGGPGEDGRVQQQLERLGVPYTGSGPAASWLAMSKSASKERFRQAGVPTPDYELIHAGEAPRAVARRAARLGFPVVVKPDSQGSSLGVGIAASARQLRQRVTAAAALDPYLIVERHIRGREFTVSLLNRQPLPIIEIIAGGPIYSFDAKYASTQTEHRFDTGLPAPITAAIERTAIAAAEAIDTRGLCRVDIMLDEAGRPWVLEVNTVPGLTGRSLAPAAAAQMGLSMSSLCTWMLHDCLTRETVA
jgi:D-alanine-D-alanine ligase